MNCSVLVARFERRLRFRVFDFAVKSKTRKESMFLEARRILGGLVPRLSGARPGRTIATRQYHGG
eukprot:3940568-Rhodomonas_salina.3